MEYFGGGASGAGPVKSSQPSEHFGGGASGAGSGHFGGLASGAGGARGASG